MKLSEFVLQYLEETDISGREFARRCGLSPQTISNIINGNTKSGKPIRIDTETLAKIANGTGLGTNARFSSVNGVTYISVPGVTKDDENFPLLEFQQEDDIVSGADMLALLEDMRTRPDMRMLFKLAHGATEEDLRQAVKIIEALRKE